MNLQMPQWWWQTDEYSQESDIPPGFEEQAGPNGIGVVRAYHDGSTARGWGEKTFHKYYAKNLFTMSSIRGHVSKGLPFAYLMRSMQIICIDIDGKNGGIEHAHELLGNAPATLAETSKSGTGYHLFYLVPDEWDMKKGYSKFTDSIGIVTGVDIRATGCVYHYPQQRWNNREMVELPKWIYDRLMKKKQLAETRLKLIEQVDELTDLEKMMLHEELLEELKKPIADGKRNNTLFAIGSQMKDAKVPNWDRLIEERALDVGLDIFEADKLIQNISKYGAVSQP